MTNHIDTIADGIITYLKNQNQLNLLPQVIKALIQKSTASSQVLIESAYPLTDSEKHQIKILLTRKFPQLRDFNYLVNSELIGGLKIIAGSQQLDLSVLAQIKQHED